MVVAQGGDTYVRVFPGRVEPSKSADLSFQVPGLVVSLPLREGQKVAKGQIIARLRQDEFQARRMAAQGEVDQARAALDALRQGERPEEQIRREAQLRAAEAKLANAKTEFERYARLLPSAAVSRAEYELAETAYHVAQEECKAARQLVEKGTVARKEDIEAQEGQVRTLEGRLADANVQLSDSTLRAPYNGVIGRRLIEEGQVVSPNKPAVQFQNVDDLDIVVDVPEAAMGGDFRGGNTTQMVAEFTNAPGLQFPVRVTVSAVFKQDTGQQVVWVVGPDGTVRCRSVAMGNAREGQVEILAGLRPGERIAVAGAPFLREGMKVRDLGDALGGG
jgi:multidrug efflux pump subunit AcrA (membrane-fusion protein)